jgi:hypothetical protein
VNMAPLHFFFLSSIYIPFISIHRCVCVYALPAMFHVTATGTQESGTA